MGNINISTARTKAYANKQGAMTTNVIQNKPNQSQFQTQKRLISLASQEIATHSTALRAGFLGMTTTVPSFPPEVAFSPERKRRASGALLSFRPERSGVEKSIQTTPHTSSFRRMVEPLLREVQKDPSTAARGDDGPRSERQAVGRRGGNLWTVLWEGGKVVGIPAGVYWWCDAAAGVRICAVKDRIYGRKCRANRARGY